MTTVKAQTRSINGRRHYVVIDDDGVRWDVPSVSTIKSLMASPALEGWKINQHILAAYRQRDVLASLNSEHAAKRYVRSIAASDTYAIDYGNDVHRVAEATLYGRPLPGGLKVLSRIEADKVASLVEDLVARFEVEPVIVEQAVARWSNGAPVYAGTLDLAARLTLPGVGRVLAVVDWKSGASGLWPNDVLSTGGYEWATHLIDHQTARVQPLPEPLAASVLVHLRHTGYAVHRVETAMTPQVLEALAVALRWEDLGRSVIGPDLTEDLPTTWADWKSTAEEFANAPVEGDPL